MSDAHKAALAQGRHQSRVVRAYLTALESAKPRRGRPRSPERIANRIQAIDLALATADPMTRVRLIQERLDLTAELSARSAPDDLAAARSRLRRGGQALRRGQGDHLPGVARGGRTRLGAGPGRHHALDLT